MLIKQPKPLRPLLSLVLCLLLCLGAALSSATVAQDATTGIVTGGKLHLRATPSIQGEKLATYDNGTKVTILAEEDGWYRVRLANGDEGYMDAQYVAVGSEGRVENGNDYVNLHSAPDLDAKVVAQFTTGTHMTIHQTQGDWSYVTIEGVDGYMLSRFIVAAEPLGEEEQATAETGALQNDLALSTDGQDSVIHQAGTSLTKTSYDGPLYYTINYPQLDVQAADAAIDGWVQNALQTGQNILDNAGAGAEVEITTQYDTYLIEDRYIGVLMTGMMSSSSFAHPTDIIHTLNVDLQTGTILQPAQMIVSNQGIIDLLRLRLGDLVTGDTDINDSWLQYAVLTDEGLAILLPKGEFLASALGTLQVVLPYDELNDRALLVVEIQGGTSPKAQAFEETLEAQADTAPAAQIDPSRPMLALTFDDGPGDHTLDILEVLRQYDARATFFVVGNRVDTYQDVVRQIAAQGSEVGTHTWSHKKLTGLSPDAIEWQLQHSMEAIEALTGQPVTALRPPYGVVDQNVKSICKDLGLTIVTWSVDTEDWKTSNADATYEAIMKHAQNGSIILCHDTHASTASAMRQVIPKLVEDGYQLVTVSELLSFSETQGEAGVVYNHLDTSHLQ